MIRFLVPFLFLMFSVLIVPMIENDFLTRSNMIWFIVIMTMTLLLYQPKKKKTYIVEGDCEQIFDRIQKALSFWGKSKVSKLDKTHHCIELKTCMSLRTFGEIISINIKSLRKNQCIITMSSELKIGVWDTSNVNQKNISKFEEIMGLEPISPTHLFVLDGMRKPLNKTE